MATTGGQLQEIQASPQRATWLFLLVIALTVGLLVGGVVGRLSASSGTAATRSTHVSTVAPSGLTPAEQEQLAHQIEVVTSARMQEWERACSSKQHPSVNVC